MPEETYFGCTREWINNFIFKVFNYYNGKINSLNRCTLEIEWVDKQESTILGQTLNPNIVKIFPKIIFRNANSFQTFVFNMIMVVIHELHHADQFILYDMVAIDPEYNFTIEAPVERETARYILYNLDEIETLSDHIVDRSILDLDTIYEDSVKNKGFPYVKKNICTHILMAIYEMVSCDKERKIILDESFYDAINNKKDFCININNLIYYVIYQGNIVTDFDMFNSFVRHEFFGRMAFTASGRLVKTTGGYIVIVNCDNKHLMCMN